MLNVDLFKQKPLSSPDPNLRLTALLKEFEMLRRESEKLHIHIQRITHFTLLLASIAVPVFFQLGLKSEEGTSLESENLVNNSSLVDQVPASDSSLENQVSVIDSSLVDQVSVGDSGLKRQNSVNDGSLGERLLLDFDLEVIPIELQAFLLLLSCLFQVLSISFIGYFRNMNVNWTYLKVLDARIRELIGTSTVMGYNCNTPIN